MRAGPIGDARDAIEFERVACDRRRAVPDSARRFPASAAMARSSRSIAMTRAAPIDQQRARQPAGAGPDLDDRDVRRAAPRRARCGRCRLRSSRKFWPSDLRGDQVVPADDVAQRRQIRRSRSCMRRGAGARVSSRREPRGQLQRRDQARRIRRVPVPAMSNAVPWSGEVRTNGRPSVTLTRVVEGQRLDRDQRLVVIHAQRDVVGRARRVVEHACRPAAVRARRCRRRRSAATAGATIVAVLVAERAVLAGMRIEPGDGEARPRDAEALASGRARRCGRSRRSRSRGQLRGHVAATADGWSPAPPRAPATTASSPGATAVAGAPPSASLARYSVWPGSAKAAAVEHVLGDRIGDDGARPCRRIRRRPRGGSTAIGGRRAGVVGLARRRR